MASIGHDSADNITVTFSQLISGNLNRRPPRTAFADNQNYAVDAGRDEGGISKDA